MCALRGSRASMPRRRIAVTPACRDCINGVPKRCGTHDLYAADPEKTTYNIRTGWLDQRDNLVPKIHIFGNSSPDWLTGIADHNWLSQGPGSDAYNPKIRRIEDGRLPLH